MIQGNSSGNTTAVRGKHEKGTVDPPKTPHVMLADFFDGKEDEEAQKMLHAKRTKISQRHLMSCWQTFSMAKKTKKHRRRSTRRERRSHRKVDLTDNTTVPRTPWSWTFSAIQHAVVLDI